MGAGQSRASEVKAVLLDVNGTIFPAAAAAGVFAELGLEPAEEKVQVWFVSVLRDAFAAQCAQVFKPFKEYGAHRLHCMLKAAGKENSDGQAAMQKVMQAWQSAELHPDVVTGLKALHDKGIQVAVLTNGSVDSLTKPLLHRAGLSDIVQPLLDINMAGAWKPHPRSYRFALRQLKLRPRQVAMVASHPWDCSAAMQVGMKAVYVQRTASEMYPECWEQPTAVVSSFDELAPKLARDTAAAPAAAPAAVQQ